MALIRNIFWLTFFLAATFAFIVVFEHGTSNFAENAKKEVGQIQIVFGMKSKPEPKKAP